MRAWQMPEAGEPRDRLRIIEEPIPVPSATQIQVRMESADISFADVLQCRDSYQLSRPFPCTPGMTVAGTVAEAGPGSRFQPGDRVVGPTDPRWGGFAETCLVFGDQATTLPDGLDSDLAAAIHVPFATAWFGLYHRARLSPGETVLITAAAGGVGSAAIQLARARGCWVIAVTGDADKIRFCETLGADVCIDYRTGDLTEQVMSMTDGRGVDVAFDPVGGALFDAIRRVIAFEGRLVVIGFAAGSIPAIPANHPLIKNYSVIGVYMGAYRQQAPALVEDCYEFLHREITLGHLTPAAPERVPFDGLPSALERLATGRTIGRLVLVNDMARGPGQKDGTRGRT